MDGGGLRVDGEACVAADGVLFGEHRHGLVLNAANAIDQEERHAVVRAIVAL